jgi:hypothetical protein
MVLAGPKRRQLARKVGARCVLTNTFPLSSRWVASSSLFSQGRCSASSLEFMSRDGSYDKVLLPSHHDSNDDRRLAWRRRARRRLPTVAEEEHPGLPRHPPRRRRRRQGNRGQARGGTSSAVGPERVDDAGTPAGDMLSVVLAPGTTTGIASSLRANLKRTDDASTLAKDLQGVSLVLEIMVHFVPDTTSPPSIDQKVPFVFHPVPFRFSFDPPSDPASVSAFARAYPDLPGYHMWSFWDRLMAISTSDPWVPRKTMTPTSVEISPDSVITVPCVTSCPHVTTAFPAASTMTTASATRVATQVVNVSTSIRGITAKTTTSACRKMAMPLCLHLALTSRGS